MRSLIILAVAVISTVSCQQNATQCDSTLLGTNGFKICLFDRTNNLVTDGIAVVGNSLWYAQQDLLRQGKCYCNPNCTPSQIVCEDSAVVKALIGSLFGPGQSAANLISQLVYSTEQYNLYCYCGSQSNNACPTVTQPQKCYIPSSTTAPATN